MYITKRSLKFKLINTITNESTSWCDTATGAILKFCRYKGWYMDKDSVILFIKWYKHDNREISFETGYGWKAEHFIKSVPNAELQVENPELKYLKKYIIKAKKFLMVVDNEGKIYDPSKIEGLQKTYIFNNGSDYTARYTFSQEAVNKEYKKYAEQRFGGSRNNNYTFRRGPVPKTGIYYRKKYGRRIHYKRTNLAWEDDQCLEYNIKRRKRLVLDAWDIEPTENESKSWKQKKIRHQWMRHNRLNTLSYKYDFTYDEEMELLKELESE